MPERSELSALRDPTALAAGQYATGANLADRSALHDRFSSARVPFREWEAGLITWPEGGAVLDVGAGPGRFWANPALPRSLHVTVADISPAMVADATAAVRTHGYATHGTVTDAQALPFEDDSFDIVMANHMLYHVPDPGLALGEFRRVLRPDGVALIATNAPGHMHQLNEVVSEVFGPQTLGLNSAFAIDNGEAMLRGHFGAISWHSYINALVVDDVDAVVAYATSIPPAQHATHDQRRVLADAVRRRMTEGGGSMRIDTRTGAFVCRGRTA